MRVPAMVKQAYHIFALLAIAHVLALIGVLGYCISSGAIDREKVVQVAEILRGDDEVQEQQESTEEADELEEAVSPESAGIVHDSVEMIRHEKQRAITEVEQKLALCNSIMLRVQMERESFRREREQAAKLDKQRDTVREDEGFKRQLAILEKLSPKVAVEHLIALPDADDAARLLAEMQPRQAKKIVEAAKSGNQLAFMQRIVQRVREVAPVQAEAMSQE
jgi:flagellar motility protein MotE (MotC chaperone)